MKKATNNQQKEIKTNEEATKMENISSDSKITAATVETAEEMVTVTTAAKAQKLADKIRKDEVKLQKGVHNADGKYIIKTYTAEDGMTVYCIVQEGFKNERLYDATAEGLRAAGKAIFVSKDEFKKMRDDAKAAKKAEAEKKKAEEKAEVKKAA